MRYVLHLLCQAEAPKNPKLSSWIA